MIRVEDITKDYYLGDVPVHALKSVRFVIDDNEFLIITGRSGAGKSTLLYQLGLLDAPTSGKIHIDDREIGSLSEKERTSYRLSQLGYVFQDYALLPELTATENIMVPLLMTGMSKKDAEKKAHEALRKVDMSDRRDHLPSQLSGGQQQRVSIARAISNNPRILFADEPTANLDIDTAKNIFEVFNALHRAGQTIIMVTHESEVKNANITRHISMLDGEIEKDERIR